MRIIFLSPVHPLLTPDNPLPKWQMQMSRVRALEKIGQQVQVIRYTPNDRIRLNLLEKVWWNIKVLINVTNQIATLRQAQGKLFRNDRLIIFSLGSDVLFPVTVRLIKALLKAPLVVLSGVSPINSGNPREWSMAPLFDLILTNDDTHSQQWLKLGAKKAANLPLSAIDRDLHFPRKVIAKDIDVLFVGTITVERNLFLRKIKKMLPKNVKLVIKEFIWEEEYAMLMSRAKIVLNPLRNEMKDGANLRMFETPAFGALLLGNSGRKEWLWPGKEMIVYKNTEDAIKKIIYYLKNDKEREKIIKNGMNRVNKEHTFLDRTEEMIKIISGLHE